MDSAKATQSKLSKTRQNLQLKSTGFEARVQQDPTLEEKPITSQPPLPVVDEDVSGVCGDADDSRLHGNLMGFLLTLLPCNFSVLFLYICISDSSLI